MSALLPAVLGNGVGGVVAAVGRGVDAAQVGRRVITSLRGTGGYAERAVAPADALIDVPDDLTLPDAVALRPTIGQTFPLERASDVHAAIEARTTLGKTCWSSDEPRRLKVAVMLQPGADGTAAGTREQARYAEQLRLDGIFVGDHLKPAGPIRRAWSARGRGRRHRAHPRRRRRDGARPPRSRVGRQAARRL
jgi:alcohol dehydrogenase-like protein